MSRHGSRQRDFTDDVVAAVGHKQCFRHRLINDAARRVKQSRDAAAILMACGVRLARQRCDNSGGCDLADRVIATIHDIQIVRMIKAQRTGQIEACSCARGVGVADLICRPSKSGDDSQRSDFARAVGVEDQGNIVVTGDDYDAWRFTLEKTVRKELERSWRVFTRDPAASFGIVTDTEEALRILSTTEVQQGTRMQSLGLNFILNDETCAAFYRNLVRDGVGSGYALVTALRVGDEIVATLLGIRCGARYVMIRISNAGDKWSNCSPGRLIIERTMAALHRDGVREFDFSIGNYAYKRRFGVTRTPLVDLSAALSWRGVPHALRDRAVRELRRYPRFTALLKRALGKPPSREES